MDTLVEDVREDGFRTAAERRKRLGQYFTGVRLARTLAALARCHGARSVLDPMAGTGDMLIGCLAHGAVPELLGAIEIDSSAHSLCSERLRAAGAEAAAVVLGDAFSLEAIRRLPTTTWDAVITNPPYVRYQSVARAAGLDLSLPSAVEIRQGLVSAIAEMDALDDTDKALFRQLAERYSGLADLAVPSWILCAGLVAPGGMLAMLVPNTWLNRDYAHPIQYILGRWFDVQYVVEDGDATWFSDALVRTTLVVAQRVERRPTAFGGEPADGYLHMTVGAGAADDRSVVGGLYPDVSDPDLVFADAAAAWRTARRIPLGGPVTGEWVPASYTARALEHSAGGSAWLRRLEGRAARSRADVAVAPLALSTLVGGRHDALATFGELGWRTGQGLRTGANQFYYAELAGKAVSHEQLLTSKVLGGRLIEVPLDATAPVLRRQAELPAGFAIRAGQLDGRVLVLDRYALPEDIVDRLTFHEVLPPDFAAHIRAAAETNVGSAAEPRFIPQLSAVITNVRAPVKVGVQPRFWYQLPPLKNRHRPSLTLARVNHGHPKTYLNARRASVIDGNFSTLWPTETAQVDEYALLAVLNSAWCAAALELNCNVMGGGALKVEATHLARLPLPKTGAAAWPELSRLGRLLAGAQGARDQLLATIDELVIESLVGRRRASWTLAAVREIALAKLKARSR